MIEDLYPRVAIELRRSWCHIILFSTAWFSGIDVLCGAGSVNGCQVNCGLILLLCQQIKLSFLLTTLLLKIVSSSLLCQKCHADCVCIFEALLYNFIANICICSSFNCFECWPAFERMISSRGKGEGCRFGDGGRSRENKTSRVRDVAYHPLVHPQTPSQCNVSTAWLGIQ